MNVFPASHILDLSGLPRQRGRIHGESLRGEIHELLTRWKEWLAPSIKDTPDQFISQLIDETDFTSAIEKWTPSLLEEVRGIAEGAVTTFEDIFAFQLLDEHWWFEQDQRRLLKKEEGRCSSIGWLGNEESPTLVAQNMDLADYLDGYQVVLHIHDPQTGVDSLVFSVAGLIALNGVNNYSVGIVCNNLSQLNHSRCGLPVAYAHRGVLEKKTFAEAKAFLQNIHHASGQNYLFGSPTEIGDLECSANQAAEYNQTELGMKMCHTNHPFSSTDFRADFLQMKPSTSTHKEFFDIYNVNSSTRFDTINSQLEAIDSRDLSLETAKRLLSSHKSEEYPVCRHSRPELRWMTVGTSMMTLSGNPKLHVCPGPPCSSTFSQFEFS